MASVQPSSSFALHTYSHVLGDLCIKKKGGQWVAMGIKIFILLGSQLPFPLLISYSSQIDRVWTSPLLLAFDIINFAHANQ
jgi:hypothetical protein